MDWIIFITGIISVSFAVIKNKNTWLVGIINVVLLSYVFLKAELYGNFLLQLFYLLGSIVGYKVWAKKVKFDMVVIIEVAVLSLIVSLYYGWENFLDIMSAVLAMAATILLIQKNIWCWVLYTLSNFGAIYLCMEKGLQVIAAQYIFFIILNLVGYYIWRNEQVRGVLGSNQG